MAPVLLLPTTMPEYAVTSIDRIGKLLRSPNDNIDCYSIQNQKMINFTIYSKTEKCPIQKYRVDKQCKNKYFIQSSVRDNT